MLQNYKEELINKINDFSKEDAIFSAHKVKALSMSNGDWELSQEYLRPNQKINEFIMIEISENIMDFDRTVGMPYKFSAKSDIDLKNIYEFVKTYIKYNPMWRILRDVKDDELEKGTTMDDIYKMFYKKMKKYSFLKLNRK